MNTLIHADIFFFVTTVAIIVLGVLFAIGLAYLIVILNDVRHISKKVREESQRIIDDVDSFRQNVKEEGFGVRQMYRIVARTFGLHRSTRRSHSKSEEK